MDKVPRLYAYTPLTRSEGVADAWVFIGIPSAKVLKNANLLLVQNLTFLGILTLAALAAAWAGGNWFVLRQVRVLLQTTEALAAGNLKARTGIKSVAGELDQLGRSFDEMANAMEQRVLERERAEQDLKALNEKLEQRVEERTSELERSNRDLAQFAYAASHDLQEPLRTVTNFLQLLEKHSGAKLGDEGREYLEYSLAGARRMQQLIADLLNYAKLGNKPKVMERIDCEDVLVHVLHNLNAAVAASGATIEHGPLPLVKGDAGQLSLLFQNLIGNALKFKSDRPLKIEIIASRKEDQWQFAIKDNGIGIDPKNFQRIFEIFQRLHTREEYPGTGIGLSIAKKIVEAHGGRIWVESTITEGTTFFFTLPAIDEDIKKKPAARMK
jgi:signal transduction histidine kinase